MPSTCYIPFTTKTTCLPMPTPTSPRSERVFIALARARRPATTTRRGPYRSSATTRPAATTLRPRARGSGCGARAPPPPSCRWLRPSLVPACRRRLARAHPQRTFQGSLTRAKFVHPPKTAPPKIGRKSSALSRSKCRKRGRAGEGEGE